MGKYGVVCLVVLLCKWRRILTFLVTLLILLDSCVKLGLNDLDENDGTHVGGFRGGDVLVPSNYDETGGVAKVDVSNNMINHVTFYNFAYPILQFYLTHLQWIMF